jgi:hypothetical protein
LDDQAVLNRLVALGLTSEEAGHLITEMDEMNWTADSNSRPTGIGWLSALAAVGVTGASGFFLAPFLGISARFVRVIFVLPFVALGFVVHVGLSNLLEKAGMRTTRASPISIPDEAVLKGLVQEMRK